MAQAKLCPTCLKKTPTGLLAGSASRACDSPSQGYEFEPHVGAEIT